MPCSAFISCRLPPSETVEEICSMLLPEITPYVSTDVKLGSLPKCLKERIARSDCLIAIFAERGGSDFIQNEIGIAYALNKPIFAICEQDLDIGGIQPYLSTFIKYASTNLDSISRQLASLKLTVTQEVVSREIAGGPEAILDQLATNGVEALYADRASAFREFMPVWEREKNICIVGSSMGGFRRGMGIEAADLLLPKLRDESTTIQILLTHASYAKLREVPEGEPKDYIVEQIKKADRTLQRLRDDAGCDDRLEWRFFRGAPTCFMVMAGPYMLLNPYLYLQPAYFNFAMIVKDTSTYFDIFNRYRKYHFQRVWEDSSLCTVGFEGMSGES